MTHSLQFSSNTGLLDARSVAQILHSLSSRFSAVEFADFCTIAEQIVLRDQIIIVGQIDKFPAHLRLVLKPLLDANVFVSPGIRFPVPQLSADPRQLQATRAAIARNLTTATIEDATFEARRVLGAEAHFGVAATPLLRQLQHFGLVRRTCFEHSVWDVSSQYQRLSEFVFELRRRIQAAAELPQVSIPPIALQAIQRSRRFEQVIDNLLQIRRDFTPLREHMGDIEDRFRKGQISPGQLLELESAWRARWDGLVSKLGGPSGRLAIVRTSVPLLKDGIRIVTGLVNQDAFDVVAAAVGWIGPGFEVLGSLRIRPVHRSVSNYLNTSDKELLRSVARIFDTDFISLDSDMRALAFQPGSPWRVAMENQTPAAYNAPFPPKAAAPSPAIIPPRPTARVPTSSYPTAPLARPIAPSWPSRDNVD